jgi:hypothetical protein
MCNPGSIILYFQQLVIEQVTVASVPMRENQTNDSVTPRTCDSATPTGAGSLCQEHDNVKRIPIKAPALRLHEKNSHYVSIKLPGSEKQNCLTTVCSVRQEETLKIRSVPTSCCSNFEVPTTSW